MARVRVVKDREFDPAQAVRVGVVIFGVLFALLLINGTYFQVESEEDAVVTRFGAFQRVVGPGLHFKWPLMESVQKVPTRRVLKMEFGFRTEQAGVRTTYSSASQRDESLMLTGDLNAAEVQWIVQYKVNDPQQYLFAVKDPDDTLRDLSEAVMRTVVGDRSVFEVLTVGRDEIKVEVERQLQTDLDRYEAGIEVVRVQLQTVGPPDEQVKTAFNAVNQAEQEKQKTVNQALRNYNEIIPKARGEGEKTVAVAEGFKIERVNRAKGEVARFKALLAEYESSPDVTRRRLYLEAMAEILPALGSKIIVDEDVKGALPLLHLGAGSEGGQR